MKAKLILVLAMSFIPMATASANDAWIKVDANGNAIGGAIVCSSDVCGDSKSVYSQLTLQPGERYVMQFRGDPVTGNVAGIPATQPDIKLQVDLQTNQWTMTSRQELAQPTPVVVNGQVSVVTGIERQQTWNPLIAGQESPTSVALNAAEDYDLWYWDWLNWDWETMDAWMQSFWTWYAEQGFESQP